MTSDATTTRAFGARLAPRGVLRYSLGEPRTLVSVALTYVAIGLSLIALFPLFWVLWMLMSRGAALLSPALLFELTPGAGMLGGGIGNALVGTVVIAVLATLLSLPLGFLAGVYLAEYGGNTKLATTVRFAAKVLTGLPSILAGVFGYATVVVATGHFSALAGGVAMGVLMVPTVMLTAEQALRGVPQKMKLAALGMGATQAETVLRVVVPTAMPGILTGVMLALARAMGETAPLLFTALFSDYWFEGHLGEPIASLAVLIYNFSGSPFENQIQLAWAASLLFTALFSDYWFEGHLGEPIASLAVLIYNFSGSPFENQIQLAWAASLVLVVFVLVLNVIAQLITRRPKEY